jgi:hypothetical protein
LSLWCPKLSFSSRLFVAARHHAAIRNR